MTPLRDGVERVADECAADVAGIADAGSRSGDEAKRTVLCTQVDGGVDAVAVGEGQLLHLAARGSGEGEFRLRRESFAEDVRTEAGAEPSR